MSTLRPLPLSVLVRRALDELPTGSIYDLPLARVYRGFAGVDLSVPFHGHRAATPLGPAAGPHTQLAHNVALAFLAGGRLLELKTVQENDRITVPRPSIDMRNLSLNVEWSQELTLEDSLREYAKARLLVAILAEMCEVPAGERDMVVDVSVGYDLRGIRSPKMSAFFDALRDARALLDAERAMLRRELPASLRRWADVPCPERLADSVTLSTFHGCPPAEIDAIGRHLLEDRGLHTVVKLNPTLLGYAEVEEILLGRLACSDVALRRAAFERDLKWSDALCVARGLTAAAARVGLGFGLKVTNTLVVKNTGGRLAGEEAYLSGGPLHAIALALGLRLREALGASLPLSFSAGVDATNVADVVACGFVPVTSCTDLLRPGGYARLFRQVEALAAALKMVGAATLPAFVQARAGPEDGDIDEAFLANLRRVAAKSRDVANGAAAHRPPRKVGSHLHLLDCLNCNACIPVCPNDANFAYEIPAGTIEYRDLVLRGARLVPSEARTLARGGARSSPHQLANWADACNDCGNCDVFCPEDGGPHVEKPRLFSSLFSFLADAPRPGFFFRREKDGSIAARGRWDGRDVTLLVAPDGSALFRDEFAELRFSSAEAAAPDEARILGPQPPEGHVVSVGHYHTLRALAAGLFAPGAVSWLTATFPIASARETST